MTAASPRRQAVSEGATARLADAPESQPAPSVLIVGRHQLFAEALALSLREAGFEVVGLCRDATSIAAAAPSPPDVGVVDLRPHDSHDLSAGRRLLSRWPGMKLLALTPIGDQFAPRAAVTEGFHGCMSKEAPLSHLAGSIHAVFAGDSVMPDETGARIRNGSRQSGTGAAARARNLTGRELEVLALLVQGRRSSEMAESLDIGLNTVRTHVQNILTKLHVHSRLEAASVAVRHGLVSQRRAASRPVIPVQ